MVLVTFKIFAERPFFRIKNDGHELLLKDWVADVLVRQKTNYNSEDHNE